MSEKRFERPDFDATLALSMEEQWRKMQANASAWGLGTTDRWDADFELGFIKFSNSDGFTVTADVQVIGTYYPSDSSWWWGWDHPSVPAPLAHAARLVRDFGDRYELGRYTQSQIRCTQDEAWQFTALGLHLSGGSGSYRGPSVDTFVFMTFGDVTIRHLH